MTSQSYTEKLRDPRWQKRRLEIMQRDFFQCAKCQVADKTLHVHHRYYVKGREPWEYPAFALVTLCESCHDENHETSEIQEWERVFDWLSADGRPALIEGELFYLCGDIHEAMSRGLSASQVIESIRQFLQSNTSAA